MSMRSSETMRASCDMLLDVLEIAEQAAVLPQIAIEAIVAVRDCSQGTNDRDALRRSHDPAQGSREKSGGAVTRHG